MADEANQTNGGERKKNRIRTDKDDIDNTYMNQILEFVHDKNGLIFGSNHNIISILELNKLKQGLVLGKKEYDSVRKNLQSVKETHSEFSIRFSEQWRDMNIDILNIGAEIFRIGSQINALGNVYADAFGLAANIIKEIKDIKNESNPNKKWENVDSNKKRELLKFTKNGMIACTKLLELCNEQKQLISQALNEIKESFDHQDVEKMIEVWNDWFFEQSEQFKQIDDVIDKLSRRVIVQSENEDKPTECRIEFNKYFNGRYLVEWKNQAYQVSFF